MGVKTILFSVAPLLACAALLGALAGAGSLNPPGAPTAGTMKTLEELKPGTPIPPGDGQYTIAAPGSYYLTGNRTAADMTAIRINADNVTLDLSGFTLDGGGLCLTGIYMNGQSNVTVQNGAITGFEYGIREHNITQTSQGHQLLNLCVRDCSKSGISFWGTNHIVHNCRALDNGEDGIFCSAGNSRIKDCTASGNGKDGIYTTLSSVVTGNTVSDNGRYGIYAYYNCIVKDNCSYGNGSSGILASGVIVGNSAYYNQTSGITVGAGSVVDQNSAYNNDQSGSHYPNISVQSTATLGLNAD